jgi:hypothetical protein
MRTVTRDFWLEDDSLNAYYYWSGTVRIHDMGHEEYEFSPVLVCEFDRDDFEADIEELRDDLQARLQDVMYYAAIGR